MNDKKCHIPTVGSKCVSENNKESCRFEPQFYDLSTEDSPGNDNPFGKCGVKDHSSCPTQHECFYIMQGLGKNNMANNINECVDSLGAQTGITPDNPYLQVCRAKCTFLISIGEFIERHLHIPGQDPDYHNYFETIYCPLKEKEDMPIEDINACISKMDKFYQNFYLKLEAPCYAGCIEDCIKAKGPPEFKWKGTPGGFETDIYHHIYLIDNS